MDCLLIKSSSNHFELRGHRGRCKAVDLTTHFGYPVEHASIWAPSLGETCASIWYLSNQLCISMLESA
jgi:hypothetical protein